MTEPMTLIERLRNPQWIHSPSCPPMLDNEQTLADMSEAADALIAAQPLMGVQRPEDVARHDMLIVPTNPCLKKLCVDEPFFVLLGRDEQAPMAVERWADYRAAAEGESDWTKQAREVANSMRAYRIARKAGLASTATAALPHAGQPLNERALSAAGQPEVKP